LERVEQSRDSLPSIERTKERAMATAVEEKVKQAKPAHKAVPTPEQVPRANELLFTDDEVRELAYKKWETAGRPCSDGVCYWLEAEHELLVGRPGKHM
jgi:hypothetical protein